MKNIENHMNTLEWITLFFYASLGLELTIWHTPSVASSVNILAKDTNLTDVFSYKFQWVFQQPLWRKILLFFTPLFFICIAQIYPLYSFFYLLKPESTIMVSPFLAGGLIIVGRAISLIYIFTIRRQNKQKGNSFKLHTNGIFRFSRNPGLMGLYLSFLGFFILLPYWFFGICLLIYFLHMHFKILLEEDFLTNKFGETYQEYFIKSRRYF